MFRNNRSKTTLSMLFLTFTLLLAACAPQTVIVATPTRSAEAVMTEAAAAAFLQLTLTAAANSPTPPPSATPEPTHTPAPPTATPELPALPPAATNTPAAANPQPSQDAASFVSDVTIPDGTLIAPGATFDKTWRIKNTGQSTWTSSYSLVYIDGERMGAPDKIDLPKEVKPGETVDITVRLTAPQNNGSYQTYFRLRNTAGQFFKLDGSGDLWFKIVVGSGPTSTPGATNTVDPSANPTATETLTPTAP